MYIIFLLLIVLFIISIFSVNWPLKLYHHFLLSKLAGVLDLAIEKNSLLSNVYSQINGVYNGKNLKIRFVEGSADSIQATPGLELRLRWSPGFLMEFSKFKQSKREWGDFKRFLTGEKIIDAAWFILTDNLEMAEDLWKTKQEQLQSLLNTYALINQILISKTEVIIQLRHFHSCHDIVSLLEQFSKICES